MRTLALIWVLFVVGLAMIANFVKTTKTGKIVEGLVPFVLNLMVMTAVIFLYATGDGS